MAPTTDIFPCPRCGQLDTPANREALEDLHWRRKGGRQHNEPLVYTAEEFEDSYDPEFDDFTANYAMEHSMAERGLCPGCGLPELSGLTEDDFDSVEDARELAEMYAEMEAERRAGC